MERFAEWLYRRHRNHYQLTYLLVAIVFVEVVVVVPAVVVGALYAHLGLIGFAGVLIAASAVQPLAVGLGFVASVPMLHGLAKWIDGDATDPLTAFNAARRLPVVLVVRVVVAEVLLHWAVTMVVFTHLGHLSVNATVALGLMLDGSIVWGGVLVLTGSYVLIRPVLAETAALLPPRPSTPHRSSSIRVRLLLGAAVMAMAGVFAAPAIALTSSSVAGRVTLALICGLTWAAFAVAVLGMSVVGPLLWPLRDLTAATRRVKAGDFAVPVPVTSDDELGELAVSFNEMQHGLQQREALHSALGAYVDPTVARRIVEEGALLAGEELDLTVMFLDMRDFTVFSAMREPREVVARLNDLWNIVVPIINEHEGHANKFVGDVVLAVFGAPIPLANHAERAVMAAREIVAAVQERYGDDLRVGAGINSGPVLVGTLGGGGRLEFTVIGDTVNVASRVQELTKEVGVPILLTASTRELLGDAGDGTQSRGPFIIRGKAEPVEIYSVAATLVAEAELVSD